MAEESKAKWEGKATAKLSSSKPEQVWPFLEDFCSIHKWNPNLDTSYSVEGTYAQPGLIRYCASTVPPQIDGQEKTVKWCHEKLLAVDPIGRSIVYEVTENNMGLKSYVSTMKIIEEEEGKGCLIEWSFVSDPMEWFKLEEYFVSYIESTLQIMAEKMEKALKQV